MGINGGILDFEVWCPIRSSFYGSHDP